MYCLGMRPPTMFSSNTKGSGASSGQRLQPADDVGILPRTTRLLAVAMFETTVATVGASR